METLYDKMNEKPIEELVNEWKERANDEFSTQIKEICEQTNSYFKDDNKYYTNPMESFIWFYALSNDKEKTYEKIENYMLHSPSIMAKLKASNIDNMYKSLKHMQQIINDENNDTRRT